MRGVVSSPNDDEGPGPVVTKAKSITVVDSEESIESTTLVTRKCRRLGKCDLLDLNFGAS